MANMKFVAFFTVLFLFVGLSHQLPELRNCPAGFQPPTSIADSCGTYTCDGSGNIVGSGCPVYQCEVQTGYIQPDNSKPFPDCCGGPVCATGST